MNAQNILRLSLNELKFQYEKISNPVASMIDSDSMSGYFINRVSARNLYILKTLFFF